MSDRGYKLMEKVFGRNKEHGFFFLICIILLACIALGSLGVISRVQLAGNSIEFRTKEDLSVVITEAVEESVGPLREDLNTFRDDFGTFYGFYIWNEEVLLTEEVNDSNPVIAEHARLALSILHGENPSLPEASK